MKVLVTGGAGFIGSHLVEKLIEENEVMIIDNLDEGKREYVHEEAKFRKVDIRKKSKVESTVKDFNPEIIYHLAAYNDAMGSIEQPREAIDTNIHGTVNILEACIENDVKKIIYASSGGLSYGEPEQTPTTEEHQLKPVYPYGITKTCGTLFIKDYSRRKNLNYAVCRLGSVYGPRANGGVIKNFFEKLRKNEKPVIFGDGTQTRDFIHVKDVVRGLRKAADKGDGEYNLGNGVQTSVNELLELIEEVTEQDIDPIYKNRWQGDIDRCELSCKKSKNEINWKPQIDLFEGLKKCKRYYYN